MIKTNYIWLSIVQFIATVATTTTATTVVVKRTAEFPLLDQLFPHQSIDDAWERYALLSKARLASPQEEEDKISAKRELQNENYDNDDKTCTNATLLAGTIPTVFVPPPQSQPDNKVALNVTERLALAQSLLNLEHAIPAIVPNHQRTGQKADLAKRFQNGSDVDFYFDHQPKHKQRLTSWEQTHDIVFEQNYTLILLGLQMQYSPIARFATFLHHESSAHYTTCNMYLTPPGDHAGFAWHMDWMDVVVVQVSGRKLWRVARQPTEYLPTSDQTALLGDISDDFGVVSYEEFFMEPGDVLYIPRGVVHNATSIDDGIASTSEPSLHLTFGIEHEGYTSFEGILQHGAVLFGEKTPNFHNGARIIMGEGCEDKEDNVAENWIVLLNLAISRLARLDCDACRVMRQSVPRHEGWKQVYAQRVTAKVGKGTDEAFSFEQALTVDYESMIHQLAADTTLNETLSFALNLYKEELDEDFSFATQPEDFAVEDLECYTEGEIDEEVFASMVKKFTTFALENRQAVMERFQAMVNEEDEETLVSDNKFLDKKWGHTRSCNAEYPLLLRFANQSIDCQEE